MEHIWKGEGWGRKWVPQSIVDEIEEGVGQKVEGCSCIKSSKIAKIASR